MSRGSSLILRGSRLPFFYGWLLVAVGFITMAVGVNARTAFSLLFPQILDEFGWDRGVTAGAFSFGFLVSAVVTPCVGWLTDRRGPRLVIAPLLFRRDGDCHEAQERRHQEQPYSMH